MLIERVTAKNFKVFGDFAVEGLRPVTLLGGDNGCGKTSLLEAVLLCMHRKKSSYPIYTALREKQLDSAAFAELIHHAGSKRKFSITCSGGGMECTTDAEIVNEAEDEYAPPRIRESGGNGDRLPIGSTQTFQLRVHYKEKKDKRGSMIFKIGKEYPYVTFDKVGRFYDGAQFVHMRPNGGLSSVFSQDPQHFDALNKKIDKPEIIKALQIVAPHTQVIFLGLENDGPAVKIELKTGEEISPAALGAGTHKLLSLALVLHSHRSGIFLLDEITIGWHHSHLVNLWRMIFQICRKRNHQIIATTHSYEGITAFVEAAEHENYQADVCYIRLDRLENNGSLQIKPAVYDHETLAAAREMQWEIRG